MAFGFSFGSSKSRSKSFVDSAQQPFLDFVRNQGQSLAQQQLNPIQSRSSRLAGGLLREGRGFLSELGSNQFLKDLQTQSGGNPALVQRQVGQLGQDLGNFFQEQILPGIQSDAINVGALGGSRQGVAEGLAAQGLGRSFASGVTDIYGQDAERGLAASTAGAGLLNQANLGGLSSLEGLYSLGLSPFASAFQPLLLQNSIVGAPTVLGSGKSTAFNFSGGVEL